MADKQVQIRKGTTAANDGFIATSGSTGYFPWQEVMEIIKIDMKQRADVKSLLFIDNSLIVYLIL